MKIQFVAGVAPITADYALSSSLYLDALRLPLEDEDGYLSTDTLKGITHFGVWPIEAAARACFGEETWPADVPIPQATIEFELEDSSAVQAGAEELAGLGYELIHETKQEPWGQTLARFLSPEGLLIGLSHAPWLHEQEVAGDVVD